jgi:hypothetical protein
MDMKRLPLLTLIFAMLSAVFFLLLIFLRIPSPLYPLMSIQDTLDLLTPLVLIPIYWLLFTQAAVEPPKKAGQIAFMVLAALWVLGQGMHLAANSINNLTEGLAKKQVLDILSSDIYTLTYFYDEYLSHFIWHLGIVGLAALIIHRAWRGTSPVATHWWYAGIGGFIYGLTKFMVFDEGQTAAVIGFPFSLILTIIFLIWGRKKLAGSPVLSFFFIAFAVALVLLAGWYLYWGCFTEILSPASCRLAS